MNTWRPVTISVCALLGTLLALVACAGPAGSQDSVGGPAYAVPSDMMQPNGLMTNGLLPANPGEES